MSLQPHMVSNESNEQHDHTYIAQQMHHGLSLDQRDSQRPLQSAHSPSHEHDDDHNAEQNSNGQNGKTGFLAKFKGKLKRQNSRPRKASNTDNNKDNAVEQKSNKQIERKLQEEEMEQKSTLEILLLGAGGGGKTTVFKQMQKLFRGRIDAKEMEFALDDIRENVMGDIIDLCKYNLELNAEYAQKTADDAKQNENNEDEDTNPYQIETTALQQVCQRIASLNAIDQASRFLTKSMAKDITLLWKEAAMKQTWETRRKSHIMDNTPWFLDKVEEIARSDWTVTFDDFVRLRDHTTGVVHKKFLVQTEHGNYKFDVTDVGGQRSERRKWLKLFDNVDVVVYIMNLAGYDQVLYEDNTKNCLAETLELFHSTCQSKAFKETDFVIFFNKVDIFEEKIKTVPFTVFKPDFPVKYAKDEMQVRAFIQQEFTERFYDNHSQTERSKTRGQIYFHTTCATDAVQVGEIIKKVQIDIITSAMKRMGYLF
eukprot:CAMPEP_0197021762 /NCGR_PEP_ID=MMETSP1384-20130603/2691_1 /TAXON_ID=29189 /ORGANISM="Ammonia sp." /LENGTH=481 /DNA_ID=CAMNT_0042449667 /DNA_START=55 /DNA_END=1500 /DNA_ORIENTATION=+